MRPRATVGGFAGLLLLPACGAPPADSVRPNPPRWAESIGLPYAALSLPVGRHVGNDPPWTVDGPPLVLNLEGSGGAFLYGRTFGPPPTESARLPDGLRDGVRDLVRRGEAAVRGGAPPYVAVVRADRAARWSLVRDTLALLREPEVSLEHVTFAFDMGGSRNPDFEGRLDAELGGLDSWPPVAETPRPRLRLEHLEEADRPLRSTRVWVGESAFDLPPTFYSGRPEHDDALRASRRLVWDQVEAAIGAADGAPTAGVDVHVGERVPWDDAAALLDMLVGMRRTWVRFPDSDFALRLGPEKGRLDPSVPRDRDPRDWSLAFALGVGGLAAVVAFAIGLRGFRSRPRRTKAKVAP